MRVSIAIALLLSVCSGWAFHEGKPPGATFVPEVTDQRLAEDQRRQVVTGEVGTVRDREEESLGRAETSPEAADNVASVHEAANDVLKEAGQEKLEQRGHPSWFMGVFFASVGLGTVAYAKHWANRNLPEPPAKRLK